MNEPTSWFWNIRVGDKIQINGAGLWYTVVGPMVITPQRDHDRRRHLRQHRDVRQRGRRRALRPAGVTQAGLAVTPEFLFLVNGVDDNKNGWIDEGFDGLDNNSNGIIDDLTEWEAESWNGSLSVAGRAVLNQPYTIRRRPAPASNSRETALPTNVVIDLTTWNYPSTFSTLNRPIFSAVPVSTGRDQSVSGVCRHPRVPQRHRRSHDDLFDPVVVQHGRGILPFLAGRAQRCGRTDRAHQ